MSKLLQLENELNDAKISLKEWTKIVKDAYIDFERNNSDDIKYKLQRKINDIINPPIKIQKIRKWWNRAPAPLPTPVAKEIECLIKRYNSSGIDIDYCLNLKAALKLIKNEFQNFDLQTTYYSTGEFINITLSAAYEDDNTNEPNKITGNITWHISYEEYEA